MRGGWKRTFVLLSSGILLLAGLLGWFPQSLLVGVERWLVVETPLQEADFVVALGGDRERQEEAVRLLKQGLGQRVLFVGSDVRPHDYACLGVPAGQAVLPLPNPAYTTYEEALVVRQVVQERGVRSVLIVTSPYHLRQARWTFERVFCGSRVTLPFSPSPNGAFPMEAWWRSHFGRKTVFLALVYYWLTV